MHSLVILLSLNPPIYILSLKHAKECSILIQWSFTYGTITLCKVRNIYFTVDIPVYKYLNV